MNTGTKARWKLLGRWVAGTTAGIAAGCLLLVALLYGVLISGWGFRSVPAEMTLVLLAGAGGAVVGLSSGLGQAWSMRRFGIDATRWTLATALAVGGGWAAVCALQLAVLDFDVGKQEELIAFVVGGFGAGALIGLAQWPLLASRVEGAGWWIVANGAAWIAGSALAAALLRLIDQGLLKTVAVLLVAVMGVSLLVGAVTGLVLVILVSGLAVWPRGALSFAPPRAAHHPA